MKAGVLYVLVLLLSVAVANASAKLRDGKRFDPAATMTARAEGAPLEISEMAWALGHWKVDLTTYADGEITHTAKGHADITFMNRGHNLMERFHCSDFDGNGNELNTLSFIVYNGNAKTWGVGVADSWQENVSVFTGDMRGGGLVLHNVVRRKGGMALTYYRMTWRSAETDGFDVIVETSSDKATWTQSTHRRYSRIVEDDGLFTSADGYGVPAPGLPEEARQFDFLVGEWTNSHDLTLPNGQNPKWTANGTAVHMMNGHCVMEFSWFDTDPNLPDAATTIVRIWNRQMRRWECMYTTNRFNGILYFGGVKEGDKIVLHQFGSNTTDTPISQWIFHSWTRDSYGWYFNASNDRGTTWFKRWVIEGTRKE